MTTPPDPVRGRAPVTAGAVPPRTTGADSVALVPAGAPLLNPANALTALRIVLVPVFLLVLASADGRSGIRWLAWGVFALASLTDRVDGAVARSHGLVTEVGKLADPIADKALTGSALIALSALGDLPWWVTVVIGVREFGITALRMLVLRSGVIPASRGGKIKTVLQGVTISFYLWPVGGVLGTVRAVLMVVTVAVTLGTGLEYVARAVAARRRGPA